ncbi:hypothetical protein ACQZ4U_23885, partial [Agrobacterium vitis]
NAKTGVTGNTSRHAPDNGSLRARLAHAFFNDIGLKQTSYDFHKRGNDPSEKDLPRGLRSP